VACVGVWCLGDAAQTVAIPTTQFLDHGDRSAVLAVHDMAIEAESAVTKVEFEPAEFGRLTSRCVSDQFLAGGAESTAGAEQTVLLSLKRGRIGGGYDGTVVVVFASASTVCCLQRKSLGAARTNRRAPNPPREPNA